MIYHVYMRSGEMIEVDNPVHLPDPAAIDHIEEPLIRAHIMLPVAYIGDVRSEPEGRIGGFAVISRCRQSHAPS